MKKTTVTAQTQNVQASFAMNPRTKDSKTGKADRKMYPRGYAEPATAEQIMKRLTDKDIKEDVRLIREEGREDLKDTELFFLCPHYSSFRDNHRCQASIIPEAFTFKTCVDVDDLSFVGQAIERAMDLNQDPMSDWENMVEYIEYSPRKKVHIWLRMPVGKTIEETQKAFCEEIGVPFDKNCITPERYINMTGDAYYLSKNWLQPLSEQEVEERREAFLMRGLDVDGRTLKKPEMPKTAQTTPVDLSVASTTLVTPTDERIRYIANECLKEAGLEVVHLNTVGSVNNPFGGIHNAVKSMLSVGATQLLTEGEVLGVLQELMPQYWQEKNILQLVRDFYQKYTDSNQKMTQFQRRVFASSLKLGRAMKPHASVSDKNVDTQAAVYGDTASLSDIYNNTLPPLLPQKLPKLVKHVTSKTPISHKGNVAQAMFPPLGVYPRDLKFLYIDQQYRELRMNCLTIGDTGSGKDTSLNQPLKHITAPLKERDKVNRQRLKDYNAECNTKASNKAKPQRPADLIVQCVSADLTAARLAQLMDDSQGAFIYTNLHEFEQWYNVEGKTGDHCTFLNLKLADDEDNPFGQERAGAQSVNYMGPLGLNWNASTTPSRVQQMFKYVAVDGPISRTCLATTPNQGLGAPIPVYGQYDERYDKKLLPYIENLTVATGAIDCKHARRMIEQLKAECDQFTQQTQDEVFDNLTHRSLVHTFRKACLLYAANGMKWETTIEGFCRWSLHYDLWLKLHFFGDMIHNADTKTLTSRRGPRNLLEQLKPEFSREDAVNVRLQANKAVDGTTSMLSQWKHRGYIEELPDGRYKKLSTV